MEVLNYINGEWMNTERGKSRLLSAWKPFGLA